MNTSYTSYWPFPAVITVRGQTPSAAAGGGACGSLWDGLEGQSTKGRAPLGNTHLTNT